MKNNIQKIFFGVVLWSNCCPCGAIDLRVSEEFPLPEFSSLEQRSPFGDTPKPEPKPLPQKIVAPAPPPAPKKPELKLGFTGVLKVGNKTYFAIHDKTSKDEINLVLSPEKPSPLGYGAGKFDAATRTLDIQVGGHEYPCRMGEEDKKGNTTGGSSTSSAKQSLAYNPSSYDSGYSSGYNDWGWDDYDDWSWDEDDWDYWDY
jgi:hypothetical protein